MTRSDDSEGWHSCGSQSVSRPLRGGRAGAAFSRPLRRPGPGQPRRTPIRRLPPTLSPRLGRPSRPGPIRVGWPAARPTRCLPPQPRSRGPAPFCRRIAPFAGARQVYPSRPGPGQPHRTRRGAHPKHTPLPRRGGMRLALGAPAFGQGEGVHHGEGGVRGRGPAGIPVAGPLTRRGDSEGWRSWGSHGTPSKAGTPVAGCLGWVTRRSDSDG